MIRVELVSGFDLRLSPGKWEFADAERHAIDRHWAAIIAEKPFLWNGAVLICTSAEVADGTLRAVLARTDFASFIAWRDWGWPDRAARNCFCVPAVMSADGALLLGLMSERTLNHGKVYPPSGSLEPRDVRPDGTIDVFGSMAAELAEETGLRLADATPAEALAIFDGQRLALVQRFDHPFCFAAMEATFAAHRERDTHRELDAILAITSASQIDARMPVYAQELIRQFLP